MKHTPINARGAFLFVLLALAVGFGFLVKPFFAPVFLAIILCILFFPLYTWLLKIFRGRSSIAAFFSTLAVFLVIVLPTAAVVALLVNQILHFASKMEDQGVISSFLSGGFYDQYLVPVINFLRDEMNITLDLNEVLRQLGTQSARYVYNFSPAVLSNGALFFFGFFVMHFSLYFLFVDGKKLFTAIIDISPLQMKHEYRLVQEFKNMIYASVYGYLVTSLVQSILAGIGFKIAGVPTPLIFAALTFFMSLVPIVGATSVWLPITLWLFFTGHMQKAIFMGIYGGLVVSGIDNIIKPWIMRGKANIHILLIFFSLLGGITLFGPLGILFGPVITALFLACIRIYREDFLNYSETSPAVSSPPINIP